MQDSKSATLEHIATVKRIGAKFVNALQCRLIVHDKSKLKHPEKQYLDEFTKELKGSTYMSDEYKGILQKMKPGLDHHYLHNDHHPQFFKNYNCNGCHKDFKIVAPFRCDVCGYTQFQKEIDISQMSLLSITEMLIDWVAAVQRHSDGDILKSIEINQERFGYTDEMKQILLNTVKEMGCE